MDIYTFVDVYMCMSSGIPGPQLAGNTITIMEEVGLEQGLGEDRIQRDENRN